MFRFIHIFFIFSLFGCTSKPISDVDLYEAYTQLSKLVDSGNILVNRNKYFSSTYLSEVDIKDKKSLFLLKLSRYIETTDSHYQKLNGNLGCLTINGFDNEKSPVSLFVEYKKENTSWYVNYMYLNFIENKSEFINDAVCPKDIEEKKA